MTETLQTPVRELTTGSIFAGRYQVIEELGHGGMGRVYKVHDTDIKEKIALKVLRPEIALDKETIERFSNELKLARKISHRNVCRMFDLGKAEGTTFITMEFVPGEDLKKFIRKSGQLGTGRAVSIGKQVCEGLAEAHHLGIVHRDLKPQNIMVDEDGNARIMDFGIARSLRGKGITGAGVMIGTPEYMSPEQVEGKDVDQRSDIYSLGIILYEMLTGQVPFEGDTPFTIGVKHKSEIPRDPREMNTQIPPDLGRLVLKCLEKDKAKRYQSAGELHAELEKIEQGLPTTERVAPKRKPFTSRQITVSFRLKKVIIPAAALVAVVVIGIALIKILPKKGAPPTAPSKRSIAVLPFESVGSTSEDETFSSGIADDITTQLSKISELDVRSQTSSMRYEKSSLGTKEIGRELNVVYILVGRVQRAEGKVHITTRLIDAAADTNIWADTYDRDWKEIFAVQSDIAHRVAAALKAKLTPAEKERIEKKPTKDIKAYEYYVKGREYYFRYKKEENEQAVELFKKAIELDPDYALAHAGLSDAYFQRVIRFGFPGAEWFEPAVEEAQKAISLDPNLAEGYKALGSLYGVVKGWWRKAGEAYQKAVEVNPNSAIACGSLSDFYLRSGDYDKALPLAKKTVALDPALGFSYTYVGDVYYGVDDLGRAEEWYKKALELQPDLDVAHNMLINLYLALGEYNKAIEQSQMFLSKVPNDPPVWMIESAAIAELFSGHYEKVQEYYKKIGAQPVELGYIYWKAGKKDEAKKLFQENLNLAQKRLEDGDESTDVRYSLAAIYAVQGNRDEALRWLGKAVEAGERDYRFASRYPLFENIRDDERFKRIIDDMKATTAKMRRRVEQFEKESSK